MMSVINMQTETSLSTNQLAGCCVDFYQLPLTQFLLGDSFHPGGLKLTQQLAGQLLIGRDSQVLDIASGRGTSSMFLAEHYGCHVTALDLAQDNLNDTLQNAKQKNLSSQVTTVQASADKLPFQDDFFDAIICECALCLFSEPEKALREMKRVLKPKGRLGVSDIYLNQKIPEELNTLLSQVMCISGALSINGYQQLMTDAGFNQIKNRSVDWAIVDMIEKIEKQSLLLNQVNPNFNFVIPDWLKTESGLLTSIREFNQSGGLGYMIMLSRKP